MFRKIIWPIFVTGFVLCGVSSCQANPQTVQVHFVNADGKESPVVRAEVVNTPSSRGLGLMYRNQLSETSGMLFVFPDEQPRSFWMKNTYLELDMVFLAGDFSVAAIVKSAKPLTLDPRQSVQPAKYVLEIGGGLSDKWGLRPGSKLKVEGLIAQAND